MLTNQKICDVVAEALLKPTTDESANDIAMTLGLRPGAVRFGEKTIEIHDVGTTLHVQISPQGQPIVLTEAQVIALQ
jgi:hypothetical protein